MSLPQPIAQLWDDLQAVRAEILAEVRALSQPQSPWKAGEHAWSVGEVIHHLPVAEVNTRKLTTKLVKGALVTLASLPRGEHDRDHLGHIRSIKAAPGFPPS